MSNNTIFIHKFKQFFLTRWLLIKFQASKVLNTATRPQLYPNLDNLDEIRTKDDVYTTGILNNSIMTGMQPPLHDIQGNVVLKIVTDPRGPVGGGLGEEDVC